jgi:hypothetical protein
MMTSTLNELLSRALTAIYFHSAGDVADEELMEALRQAIKELESQQAQQKQVNELHTCPYREEIHGDYESLCDCDEASTYQCAQDV